MTQFCQSTQFGTFSCVQVQEQESTKSVHSTVPDKRKSTDSALEDQVSLYYQPCFVNPLPHRHCLMCQTVSQQDSVVEDEYDDLLKKLYLLFTAGEWKHHDRHKDMY